MWIVANGKRVDVAPGVTVEELVCSYGLPLGSVVAEHNGEPVARARFAEVQLRDGDRIEIVRAVAGG